MKKKSNTGVGDIGVRLKALRLAKGLSQSDLAEGVGLTFQQIQKYENGTNRISLPTAHKLCSLLGTSLNELSGVGAESLNGAVFSTPTYKLAVSFIELQKRSPGMATALRQVIDQFVKEIDFVKRARR
jgi:transcriptional regulator with XRE-family HTH domain